ncbi:MAG: septum formation protein Maf [Bdellovibrionales bacterium]|nr:septum formation protein Maf [Bdellovibrionales bacterium]
MYQLVLASQSPRRKEILQNANIPLHTFSSEISENLNENMSLDDALQELSRRKASAVIEKYASLWSRPTIVLSADTVVVLDDDILGKPKDRAHAKSHLTRLSGRTHAVKTAFCLWNLDTKEVFTDCVTSKVEFKVISPEELEAYLDTDEPYDKAGAYGIQGMGRSFVSSHDNSFFNIMGLPIERVLEVLSTKDWKIS